MENQGSVIFHSVHYYSLNFIFLSDAVIIASKQPKLAVPEVTLLKFVFENHSNFSSDQLEKPWLVYNFEIFSAKFALINHFQVNVPSGKTLTFAQARTESQKVASALARIGFKKGDVLFFVTSEFVDIYLIQLAVWMLGGAVRGTSTVESQGIIIFTTLKPSVRKLFQKVTHFK